MKLISEMKRCRTVTACHECATVDTYDEFEAATGWLTCIEEMFNKFERIKVLGREVILEGFDLKGFQVMAKCRNGCSLAFVSCESIEFPKLSNNQKLWLDALKDWNKNF